MPKDFETALKAGTVHSDFEELCVILSTVKRNMIQARLTIRFADEQGNVWESETRRSFVLKFKPQKSGDRHKTGA